MSRSLVSSLFFFNDTATTEIYTLSLHDALPISHLFLNEGCRLCEISRGGGEMTRHDVKLFRDLPTLNGDSLRLLADCIDRKSTRLNSSHSQISYAVFCLKKKKKYRTDHIVLQSY